MGLESRSKHEEKERTAVQLLVEQKDILYSFLPTFLVVLSKWRIELCMTIMFSHDIRVIDRHASDPAQDALHTIRTKL